MEEVWCITSDWQLDSAPPFDRKIEGSSLRFQDSVDQVYRVFEDAKKRGATHLKFLGDATEHKTANSLERTTLAKMFYAADYDFEIDAIPGNHDGSLYQVSSSTLEPMGILLPRMNYYDVFTFRGNADTGICQVFLPYLHGATEGEIAKLFVDFFEAEGKNWKEFYLFGHYGVTGCASGATNQILVKDLLGFDTIQAHRFKRIWMGHIHKHQWIKNAGFPGSTYSHDFGERLDQKGYILYRPASDKAEFVPIQQRYALKQVDYMSLDDDLFKDSAITSGDFEECIVKVVGYVPAPEDSGWPQTRDRLETLLTRDMGATAVFFEVERERVYRESRSTISTTQNIREAIQVYIKEQAAKLGIEDITDDVVAKAWSILDDQDAQRQQYSDVRLTSIRFKDLLSFREEVFLFEDGIHLIAALNGTGKSNALGGLYFAITGEAMTGVNMASMIRQGAKQAEVELIFSAGGSKFNLLRVLTMNPSRGNATQKIHLKENGIDIKDGGNKEAQDQAENLIGLDSLAFRNTVFFVQDDPKNIVVVPARERKEAVMACLRMSMLGSSWEQVGKLIAIENQRLSILKTKKETLDAITFDASAEDLEKEKFLKEVEAADLENKKNQGDAAIRGLEKSINEKNAAYLVLSQTYAQKNDVSTRPKTLADVWEINKARFESDLANLRKARDKSTELIATWTTEIATKETESKDALEKMEALKTGEREGFLKQIRANNATYDEERDALYEHKSSLNVKTQKVLELNAFAGMGKCPTCGQNTEHLHASGNDQRQVLNNEIHNLREHIAVKDASQKALMTATAAIQVQADAILEKENAFAAVSMQARGRIETLRAIISREETTKAETISTGKTTKAESVRQEAGFNETYAAAQVAAAAAQVEINELMEKLSASSNEIKSLEASKGALGVAIRACIEQQSPLRARLAVIANQLAQIATIAAEKKDIDYQWNKAAKDLRILEPLRKVFSPEGIQAALIESARPDLERRINHYLSALRVTKFRIQIETQSESESTGNIKETFDFLVDNGALPMLDVRSYSGGERRLMNIAIHLALTDLVLDRSGIGFPFFALDEVYDGLDDEKCRALTGLIFGLRAVTILVVCHIKEVASEYDSIIEGSYTKEGGTKFRKKSAASRGSDGIRAELAAGSEAKADQRGNKGTGAKRRSK